MIRVLGVGIVVFASTNVDDIVVLSLWFAESHMAPRAIVAGQFLGIGALIAASAVAATASVVIPAGHTALLGLVPLGLGLKRLWSSRHATDSNPEWATIQHVHSAEAPTPAATRGPIAYNFWRSALAVAGVTLANGGDNLAVYIPLFAHDPVAMPGYAAVFTMMTAVWCLVGYKLVCNRILGRRVQRYGHMALPWVLIGLGLWVLAGAVSPR